MTTPDQTGRIVRGCRANIRPHSCDRSARQRRGESSRKKTPRQEDTVPPLLSWRCRNGRLKPLCRPPVIRQQTRRQTIEPQRFGAMLSYRFYKLTSLTLSHKVSAVKHENHATYWSGHLF